MDCTNFDTLYLYRSILVVVIWLHHFSFSLTSGPIARSSNRPETRATEKLKICRSEKGIGFGSILKLVLFQGSRIFYGKSYEYVSHTLTTEKVKAKKMFVVVWVYSIKIISKAKALNIV